MNVLIINPILFTADNDIIPKVKSIKDSMIYNFVLGFKQNGHQVTLYAAEDYKPTDIETFDFNVIFGKTSLKKIFKPSVLPYLSYLNKYLRLHQNEFDLVISSEVFSFQSLFASLVCPQKTIIWHELALHQRRFFKIPSKLWYLLIAHFIQKKSLVIPRSEKAFYFVSQYMDNVSNIIVEHGINIECFTPKSRKLKQFIIVAQLIKRKNISSIIKKFKAFSEKYEKGYSLIIVGQGELERDLIDLIKRKGLEESVHLLGFKNHLELKTLLADSCAMLINTYQDNNMVSIPESISCGTPVITNTIPTNSTYIGENHLGITKDEWNEDELKKVVDENQYYVNNCIKFRKKLSNRYSAEKMVDIFWEQQEKKSIKL